MNDRPNSAVRAQQCTTCDAVYFPARLVCRRCGHDSFRGIVADVGEITDLTLLPDHDRAMATLAWRDIFFVAAVAPAAAIGDVLPLSADPAGDVAWVPSGAG